MEIILNVDSIMIKKGLGNCGLMVYITKNNLQYHTKNNDDVVVTANKIQLYNLIYEMSIHYSITIY